MSGWSPCQFLKHPTSRKVAPQRRNPYSAKALLTFIPAAHCVLSCPFQGTGHGVACGQSN